MPVECPIDGRICTRAECYEGSVKAIKLPCEIVVDSTVNHLRREIYTSAKGSGFVELGTMQKFVNLAAAQLGVGEESFIDKLQSRAVEAGNINRRG